MEKAKNIYLKMDVSNSKEDFVTLLNEFKVFKNKKGEDYISSLIKGYENYLRRMYKHNAA
ncbi:hypothetical protein QIA17_05220 (plasmid) [Borreliella californiensis]|nr:hypothetical protein [Borreliella californiensis]